MSGHSKWKNIQHRKGAQDAVRGKMFTKVTKETIVAVKAGGPDPDSNAKLRLALVKARSVNLPKDNIERAIKKGAGSNDEANYQEKIYEGYGPGGVALIVECLTDNLNRTVSEIRYIFSRAGGNLGTEGSVGYMFKKKGSIVYDKSKITDYDKLFEVALDNGAEDISDEDEVYEVLCEPEAFTTLKEKLDEIIKVEPLEASINRIPDNYVSVDSDKAESLQKLIDNLEDNDDVQNVFHNGDL